METSASFEARSAPLPYPTEGIDSLSSTPGLSRTDMPFSVADMESCICAFGIPTQFFDCSRRGNDDKFDFATLGFALCFPHHRQLSVGSGTDYQPAALPGNDFLDRQRSMSNSSRFFEGFFLRLRISPPSMTTSCS